MFLNTVLHVFSTARWRSDTTCLKGYCKIAWLADRVLWLCIVLGLVKHSDRYDGAVLFMGLWTITAVLKSISC